MSYAGRGINGVEFSGSPIPAELAAVSVPPDRWAAALAAVTDAGRGAGLKFNARRRLARRSGACTCALLLALLAAAIAVPVTMLLGGSRKGRNAAAYYEPLGVPLFVIVIPVAFAAFVLAGCCLARLAARAAAVERAAGPVLSAAVATHVAPLLAPRGMAVDVTAAPIVQPSAGCAVHARGIAAMPSVQYGIRVSLPGGPALAEVDAAVAANVMSGMTAVGLGLGLGVGPVAAGGMPPPAFATGYPVVMRAYPVYPPQYATQYPPQYAPQGTPQYPPQQYTPQGTPQYPPQWAAAPGYPTPVAYPVTQAAAPQQQAGAGGGSQAGVRPPQQLLQPQPPQYAARSGFGGGGGGGKGKEPS